MRGLLENVSKCFLYIFVPQTVDNGIEHGEDHYVEYREQPVLDLEIFRGWAQVNEHCGSIVQADSSQLGSANGECFVFSLR